MNGNKIKILILGINGMIGVKMFDHLKRFHQVRGTLRLDKRSYGNVPELQDEGIIHQIDMRDIKKIKKLLTTEKPDVLINATGIIKQVIDNYSSTELIELNSLFPHKLYELSSSMGIRLIQFSTDCVFSGNQGNYSESDRPDPIDFYGLTKYLGELDVDGAITIRTSTIGLELGSTHGLVEWFLNRKGNIGGYKNAIYTGITTKELARFVNFIITQHSDLSGLWQVAGEKISKYDLLFKLKQKLQRENMEIFPDEEYICDRSLLNNRIIEATNYKFTDWDSMLDELSHEIIQRESG